MSEKRNVLDKGYVLLRDKMGDDNTPASAARVSFDKKAEEFSDEQNAKLINYLFKNNEYSCIRHNIMSFELYMPLMVARQIYKYSVGSSFREDTYSWNEGSRRYLTDEPEFYIPAIDEWRSSPENKKQGSGDPLDASIGYDFTDDLMDYVEKGHELFDKAMFHNIAVEQARLFLPAYGMYVRCYWTASLNALFHFLNERLDNHAQYEIRQYAEAVKEIIKQEYPVIYQAWENNR